MTPPSSAACYPSQQLPLFGLAWPVDAETRTTPPCHRCGATVGFEAEGVGPHHRALRCRCGAFL
jgi:hypothetical protein